MEWGKGIGGGFFMPVGEVNLHMGAPSNRSQGRYCHPDRSGPQYAEPPITLFR